MLSLASCFLFGEEPHESQRPCMQDLTNSGLTTHHMGYLMNYTDKCVRLSVVLLFVLLFLFAHIHLQVCCCCLRASEEEETRDSALPVLCYFSFKRTLLAKEEGTPATTMSGRSGVTRHCPAIQGDGRDDRCYSASSVPESRKRSRPTRSRDTALWSLQDSDDLSKRQCQFLMQGCWLPRRTARLAATFVVLVVAALRRSDAGVRAFVIPTDLLLLPSISTNDFSAIVYDPRGTRNRARKLHSSVRTHQSTSAAHRSASAPDPINMKRPARQRKGSNSTAAALSDAAFPSSSSSAASGSAAAEILIRTRSNSRARLSKKSSSTSSSFPRRTKWDRMVARLREFRRKHGHSFVSSEYVPRGNSDSNKEMKELLVWTRSVRHNYRHQVVEIQQLAAREGGERSCVQIASHFALEVGEYLLGGATAAADDLDTEDEQRIHGGRPRLSSDRLRQLLELDFVWDAQQHAWESKYRQLVEFQQKYGHCRVPNNSVEYPRLGVWVRNQRRERKKLLQQQEPGQEQHGAASDPDAVTSTLTPDRFRRLEALEFDWYKSHDDTWNDKYRQLQQYVEEFGHANVKQDDPQYFALGQWCMNQRIADRKRQRRLAHEEAGASTAAATPESESERINNADEGKSDEMTLTRIHRLERLGFSWHVRDDAWHTMKQKLVDYYEEHGHVDIPTAPAYVKIEASGGAKSRTTEDLKLELLRTWLNRQRHEYKRLQEGLTSPMTIERIRALERSIPNFSWQIRGLKSGPSTEDWAKLFDAMRAKGLKPGMRPKSHWFEGAHPFRLSGPAAKAATKDVWTEQDLLALWNQESEEGEEDGDAELDLEAPVS